jgi:hypothetical protein
MEEQVSEPCWCKIAETDMLKMSQMNIKNKSADYFDMRKRKYKPICGYEKRLNLMQAGCGASTMTVFHHICLCFKGIYCNSKISILFFTFHFSLFTVLGFYG